MASKPTVRFIVWHATSRRGPFIGTTEAIAWLEARADHPVAHNVTDESLRAAGWRCTRVEASDA